MPADRFLKFGLLFNPMLDWIRRLLLGKKNKDLKKAESCYNIFKESGSLGSADMAGLCYYNAGHPNRALGVYLVGAKKAEEERNIRYASVLLRRALSCIEDMELSLEKTRKFYDRYFTLSIMHADEIKEADPMEAIKHFLYAGMTEKAEETAILIPSDRYMGTKAREAVESIKEKLDSLDKYKDRQEIEELVESLVPGS